MFISWNFYNNKQYNAEEVNAVDFMKYYNDDKEYSEFIIEYLLKKGAAF